MWPTSHLVPFGGVHHVQLPAGIRSQSLQVGYSRHIKHSLRRLTPAAGRWARSSTGRCRGWWSDGTGRGRGSRGGWEAPPRSCEAQRTGTERRILLPPCSGASRRRGGLAKRGDTHTRVRRGWCYAAELMLKKWELTQHPEEPAEQADHQQLPYLLQALLSCGQQAAVGELLEELVTAEPSHH